MLLQQMTLGHPQAPQNQRWTLQHDSLRRWMRWQRKARNSQASSGCCGLALTACGDAGATLLPLVNLTLPVPLFHHVLKLNLSLELSSTGKLRELRSIPFPPGSFFSTFVPHQQTLTGLDLCALSVIPAARWESTKLHGLGLGPACMIILPHAPEVADGGGIGACGEVHVIILIACRRECMMVLESALNSCITGRSCIAGLSLPLFELVQRLTTCNA